jgi:hypothetical protein
MGTAVPRRTRLGATTDRSGEPDGVERPREPAPVRTGWQPDDRPGLTLDWARCQPAEGGADPDALDDYAAALDKARQRGLEPLVTLHHVGHPAWLGEDFWLRAEAPERFREWVEAAVAVLGRGCRRWVTLDEPNTLALRSFFTGRLPPGRLMDVGAVVTAFDHLLTAHVLAYEAITSAHPDHRVALRPGRASAYELGPLLSDVLAARALGVGRDDLHAWLVRRRTDWYRRRGAAGALDSFVRRRAAACVPLEQALPRAVTAVYASTHDRCVDDVREIGRDGALHRPESGPKGP